MTLVVWLSSELCLVFNVGKLLAYTNPHSVADVREHHKNIKIVPILPPTVHVQSRFVFGGVCIALETRRSLDERLPLLPQIRPASFSMIPISWLGPTSLFLPITVISH